MLCKRRTGARRSTLNPCRSKEVFRGHTIWDGKVENFELTGHPKAKRCYAWGFYPDEKGKEMRIITALGIPPVDSPLAAVRAAISGKAQK